jgi:hypothetical protein
MQKSIVHKTSAEQIKKFTVRISLYLVVFVFIILLGLLLPPTSTNNILFSLQDKLKLADSAKRVSPDKPIVFWVGGSNVNFGIDSKLVSDALGMTCINTAVHGGLGLKFELNNAFHLARKRDIVVLMPEYENFWDFNNEMADGQAELLHTLIDVYPAGSQSIESNQWRHLLMYLPRYLHDKYIQYLPNNYKHRKEKDYGVYTRYNFNVYGDAVLHLSKPALPYIAMPKIGAPVNHSVLEFLKNKAAIFQQKGVKLYILFPAYQGSSFNNNRAAILQLYALMKAYQLPVLGSPERYCFSDTLFYDTYYHLNKEGRQIRSIFVQQDLKHALAEH